MVPCHPLRSLLVWFPFNIYLHIYIYICLYFLRFSGSFRLGDLRTAHECPCFRAAPAEPGAGGAAGPDSAESGKEADVKARDLKTKSGLCFLEIVVGPFRSFHVNGTSMLDPWQGHLPFPFFPEENLRFPPGKGIRFLKRRMVEKNAWNQPIEVMDQFRQLVSVLRASL